MVKKLNLVARPIGPLQTTGADVHQFHAALKAARRNPRKGEVASVATGRYWPAP
jgi:hypothetical protein